MIRGQSKVCLHAGALFYQHLSFVRHWFQIILIGRRAIMHNTDKVFLSLKRRLTLAAARSASRNQTAYNTATSTMRAQNIPTFGPRRLPATLYCCRITIINSCQQIRRLGGKGAEQIPPPPPHLHLVKPPHEASGRRQQGGGCFTHYQVSFKKLCAKANGDTSLPKPLRAHPSDLPCSCAPTAVAEAPEYLPKFPVSTTKNAYIRLLEVAATISQQ